MNVDFSNSCFLRSSNVLAHVNRLNWRAEVLIARAPDAIRGKRILDLASHDGRFAYAALQCGAKSVVGVEAREAHVASAYGNLRTFPEFDGRYEFIESDLVTFLSNTPAHAFDTILCFGIFSHLIEQVEVLREVQRIQPKFFILDCWVAREASNLLERWRNIRVNSIVAVSQQGKATVDSIPLRLIRLVRELLNPQIYKTGKLVFLYEDARANGATIRESGLMAWANGSLIEMLLDHFAFDCKEIDWFDQNVADWSDLSDYKTADRKSWIAQPKNLIGSQQGDVPRAPHPQQAAQS